MSWLCPHTPESSAAEPSHLKVREVLGLQGQFWYKPVNAFRFRIVTRFMCGCFIASNTRIDERSGWCGLFSPLSGEL